MKPHPAVFALGGIDAVQMILHGFTLSAPPHTRLDLLQQQVQALQALNNGLQTIITIQSQVEKSL